MIRVNKKNECCGCAACKEICPVGAIEMVEDQVEGFKYPRIDTNICIKCNRCKNVCAFINSQKVKVLEKIYAVKNKDDNIRKVSTSGGFFSVIACEVLKRSGIVYGCILDKNLNVRHERIDNIKNVKMLYGSKYVQSDMEKCYKSIEKDLKDEKLVLFSGTPCQVAAVKRYFNIQKINVKNLITCDFVCHGVPTPKIFRNHISFLEKKYKSKVKNYRFRTKSFGWRGHHEEAIFEDGKVLNSGKYLDIYKELYGSLNIIRPSCFNCKYISTNHFSDITFADFWGIENNYKEFSDNEGISFVMINTDSGSKLFDSVKDNIRYIEAKKEDCRNPKLQGIITHPKNREKFFREYDKKGYLFIARKYTTWGIIKKVKVSLYKLLKYIKD